LEHTVAERLLGKVGLVGGAARGIGAAIVDAELGVMRQQEPITTRFWGTRI
jgi:hypothetical protein